MKGINTKIASVWVFVCLHVIVLGQHKITQKRPLFGKTCEDIYKQYNKTEPNFSLPINGLSCNASAGILYHCLPDYPDRRNYIQFCGPWVWIEPEGCPAIYSGHDNIQPFKCDVESIAGCPKKQYLSHLYYKYSGCFFRKNGSTEGRSPNGSNTTITIIIVICVTLIVTVTIAAIVVYITRRHWKGCFTRNGWTPEQTKLLNKQFRHTRAIDAAAKHLREDREVLITGKSGTGMTTVILHLKERFKDLKYVEPKYGHFHLKGNAAYYVCITPNWLMEEGNVALLRSEMNKLDNRSVVVIKAAENFLQKNQEYVAEFENCTIDLSGEFELNTEEKVEFIRLQCDDHDVSEEDFTHENRLNTVLYKCKHYGFPYLMELLFEEREFCNVLEFLQEKDKSRQT